MPVVSPSATVVPDGTVCDGSDVGKLCIGSAEASQATTACPGFRHDLNNTGRVGGP